MCTMYIHFEDFVLYIIFSLSFLLHEIPSPEYDYCNEPK